MKLQKSHSMMLSLGLILLSFIGNAQSTNQDVPGTEEDKPYEVSAYMGANRLVNLMVVVHQQKGITLKVKDPTEAILHELRLKKAPKAYHIKLNFENSPSGQYKLEFNDGRNFVVRRIEVVDVPAIDAQRYITFTTPLTL